MCPIWCWPRSRRCSRPEQTRQEYAAVGGLKASAYLPHPRTLEPSTLEPSNPRTLEPYALNPLTRLGYLSKHYSAWSYALLAFNIRAGYKLALSSVYIRVVETALRVTRTYPGISNPGLLTRHVTDVRRR